MGHLWAIWVIQFSINFNSKHEDNMLELLQITGHWQLIAGLVILGAGHLIEHFFPIE